ncbi:hypothetical protein BDW72DRAFT_195760 [Aspergillus terricola var. indicus]
MIMAATAGFIGLLVLPETYAPARHENFDEFSITIRSIVTRYLNRPLLILLYEPILQLITLYMTFIYGFIYLLVEAYPVDVILDIFYFTRIWIRQTHCGGGLTMFATPIYHRLDLLASLLLVFLGVTFILITIAFYI